jgi:hypothetical protein
MRSPKTLTAVVLLIALGLSLAVYAPALAACGDGGSSDPCLQEYNARYCADDCYRDDESHPFRVLAYALNPVGVALEWAIFRPIHWAVSRPSTAPIFGHACEYDY